VLLHCQALRSNALVRLRACMDSEVRVLVRHALSGL